MEIIRTDDNKWYVPDHKGDAIATFATVQEADEWIEARVESWLHRESQWTSDGFYIWRDEDKLARKEQLRAAIHAIGNQAIELIRNETDRKVDHAIRT
jgi:hypothetical protein